MSVKRLGVLVCGIALMVALLGTASATELSLSSPTRPSYALAERCSNAPVAVTGEAGSSTVTISGLPAGCTELPLTVWLHEAGSTYRGTAVAPAAGEDVTLTVAGLQLSPQTAGLVTAATWPLQTATTVSSGSLPFVSCRTPDNPEAGCEATVAGEWQWGWPTASDWVRNLEVTSSSQTPVRWELVINLSHPSLPFHPTQTLHSTDQGLVRVAASACDAEPRTVTVRGTTGWGDHHTVSDGMTRRAQLHGTSATGSGGLFNCP